MTKQEIWVRESLMGCRMCNSKFSRDDQNMGNYVELNKWNRCPTCGSWNIDPIKDKHGKYIAA